MLTEVIHKLPKGVLTNPKGLIDGLMPNLTTNLTQTELRSRYTDRIASRLFGECKPLLFQGMDVRLQKLQ